MASWLEAEIGGEWEFLGYRGRDVLSRFASLRALVRAHLGEETAALLAEPRRDDDGTLAWRSTRGGPLVPASRHRDPERLRAALAARVNAISGLADRLDTQGDAGRAAGYLLRAALVTPDGTEALHADGDEPVLVLWGMARKGQARPAEPVAAIAAAVEEAPSPAPAPPDGASIRRRVALLPWVLTAALGGTAAALGWFAAAGPPIRHVEILPPAPPAADPVAPLVERVAALDAALAEVSASTGRFAAACIAPPDAACPPGQVAGRPSEVMLVLDASGSMGFPLGTPAALEAQLVRAVDVGNPFLAQRLHKQIMSSPGEARMSVARRVLADLTADAPEPVTFGLISFHSCSSIRNHGQFSHADRPRLRSVLSGIGPSTGTALAQAILHAAEAISGGRTPQDRVNMVVLSDGLDACGGDPCGAAAAAKRRRPGLVINVVDLSSNRALTCATEATGGAYFQPGEKMTIEDLADVTREAAGLGATAACVAEP